MNTLSAQTRQYSNPTEVVPSPGEKGFAWANSHYSDLVSNMIQEVPLWEVGHDPYSVAALYSFSLDDVQRELKAIRKEVEETCAVTDDVRAVPESAYDETLSLLKQMPRNIPMPDIMWSEDGGIGLEWRPGNGIATMSLYGDNLVIYGAFFSNAREVEGICSLSDTVLLQGFLTILRNLFQ